MVEMKELALDGTKLIHHLDALSQWKQGETVYPILVEVSPTNQCNQNCVFCAYEYLSRRPVHFIKKDILIRAVKELGGMGTKSVFYSGEGEPLLHKDLPEMVEEISAMGFDQALNTNGVLLETDRMQRILPHLSWVRISVNGGTQDSYRSVHQTDRADFGRVLKNIEAAASYKHRESLRTTIGVQMVYVGQPREEVTSLAGTAKEMGADYFTLKNFNPHPASKFRPPAEEPCEIIQQVEGFSDERYTAVVRWNLKEDGSRRPYRRCYALPFFAEILSNGDVYSCGPHLGNPKFCYGNINEMSFRSLWSLENRAPVEEHVAGLKDLDKICMPNCRLDAANRFLWDLRNPPAHINFI
ncbi:MAG: radical SAM protein [Deltaproteobacteria bacterium]|nr:radical SAM protein [Deltaproteobacteria bacterium]